MEADRPQLTTQMNQSAGSFELVVATGLFALVGYYFDGKLGSGPYLTIALAVLGFVGSVASIYQRYRVQIDRLNSETKKIQQTAKASRP